MPTTRQRRERHARIRVTPEVLDAARRGDDMAARRLLGIRPWHWGSGPLHIPLPDEETPDGADFSDMLAELDRHAD